jgi:hypothetical protein
MSRLLAEISQDPPLLQWLHTRSRSTYISEDCLAAAAYTVQSSSLLHADDAEAQHPARKAGLGHLPRPSITSPAPESSEQPTGRPRAAMHKTRLGCTSLAGGSSACRSSQPTRTSSRTPERSIAVEKTMDATAGSAGPPARVIRENNNCSQTEGMASITCDDSGNTTVASAPVQAIHQGGTSPDDALLLADAMKRDTVAVVDCDTAEQRIETETPFRAVCDSMFLQHGDTIVSMTTHACQPGELQIACPYSLPIPAGPPRQSATCETVGKWPGAKAMPPLQEPEAKLREKTRVGSFPPTEEHKFSPRQDPKHVSWKPIETLFIPVFMNERFALGEIHGSLSTSAKALIRATHREKPFVSISRKFVANLAIENCIEFVEYEWFEGGYLVTAVHTILFDGSYTARFVVFGQQNSKNNSGIPSTVLMKLDYSETADCQMCIERDIDCTCEDPVRSHHLSTQKTNSGSWSQWLTGLHRLQSRPSTAHVRMSFSKEQVELNKAFTLRIQRKEMIEVVRSTKARSLICQYAALLSTKNTFLTTDLVLSCGMDRHRGMSDSFPGEFIESSVTGTRDSRNNATASGLGFSSSGLLSEDDVFIKREG